MRHFHPLAAVLIALTCVSLANAKGPETSKPGLETEIPLAPVQLPTIPISVFLDVTYDYEVWSAPDVSGETEFVIVGQFPDGSWDFVHRFQWTGSVDHGGMSDMGIWKFSSEYAAENQAENLMDDGELIDFSVMEQPVAPTWTYEATFDTQDEAIAYADEFEEWAAKFGAPHITKIVPVQVNDPFATRTVTTTKSR